MQYPIKMHEFEYEELDEATENFSHSRLVGKGSHGYVYKGILKDGHGVRHRLVAIKKQPPGLQKLGDNSKLENEARILSSVSRNSYLVNLLGTSHDFANNKVLVMEYMPSGTLHEMLHGLDSVPLSWTNRARIGLQVAKSVQFLHETNQPPIIHRDIKSANVLFDSDWNARLGDLGLALRTSERHIESLNRPAGTIGYLDPSYTVPSQLSPKIDVFSFGVLLLEIISGQKVIDVSRSPSSIVEWAMPFIRRDRNLGICDQRAPVSRFFETMVRDMIGVAGRCVMEDEKCRPSIGEIVTELENCIVEPLRYPAWVNFLRGIIQRKSVTTSKKSEMAASNAPAVCAAVQENVHAHVSRGKLLLREVLADIS